MYLRFILFTLIDLFVGLVGLFVIPIGLLFCIKDQRTGKEVHMPRLFWWWDNEEDGVNYLGNYTSLWMRWKWCAIRNKTYNFSKHVLGVYKKGEVISLTGDANVSDALQYQTDPSLAHSGYQRLDATINGKDYFQIYWVQQYKWFPSKCFRLKLGWKLDSATDYAMCVLVPNPWKGFNIGQAVFH